MFVGPHLAIFVANTRLEGTAQEESIPGLVVFFSPRGRFLLPANDCGSADIQDSTAISNAAPFRIEPKGESLEISWAGRSASGKELVFTTTTSKHAILVLINRGERWREANDSRNGKLWVRTQKGSGC